MRKLILLVAATSALALTGCSTYTVNQYGMSSENINLMKAMEGTKFSVGQFSATKPGLSSIQCRGAGPVATPGKTSFENYINAALISELKVAGVYDDNSQIRINGLVENLDFSSNIGAGKWVFDVTVSNNGATSYPVRSEYAFSTNFVADKASQQVAQAFVPAVQQLIKDIITHPKFKELS